MDQGTRDVLTSSASEEWGTPIKLFNRCQETYGEYEIDFAASHENTLVKAMYFTKEQDALQQDWKAWLGWLNCPYGKGGVTGKWVQKAFDSAKCGAKVTLLLPSRTDTRFFHGIILPHTEFRFIKGRLVHTDWRGGEKVVTAPATFPSMIAHISPDTIGRGRMADPWNARDFD